MFWKGGHNKANIIWGYFCLLVVFWGVGGYIFSTSTSKESAFVGWQIAYICVVYVPVIYSHFVFTYLDLSKKYLLLFSYLWATLLVLVTFFAKDLFLGDLRLVFGHLYTIDWIKYKSPLWLSFYIGFYWILLLYSFFLLFKFLFRCSGLKRYQLIYFIIGSGLGWIGAHGFFFLYFRIDIYPLSNFLIAIYPLIIGYAIVRYRLMDISVVITGYSLRFSLWLARRIDGPNWS